MRIVDQRDVQRRGGVCAKFPLSCVVRDLLREAGAIRPFSQLNVIDLTYGQGIFWAALPQAKVWGFDVKRLAWVRAPYMFIQDRAQNWRNYLSVLPDRVDLVAVDPPWSKYVLKTRPNYKEVSDSEALLNVGLESARYFKAPLLVHWKERWTVPGTEVMAETWFQPLHRYSKQPKPTWFCVLCVSC